MRIRHLISLSLILCSPAAALAQNYGVDGNIPTINGHDFLTLHGLNYPFVKTSFETNIGIGSTQEITFDNVVIDTLEIEGVAGAVLFANLGFTYNQKIKDWLAFRLRYNFAARVGTEVETLLTHGVNTLSVGELFWIFRLKKHPRYLLSLSTSVSNGEADFISVSAFIKDLINQNPSPSLSQSVPSLTGSASLHWVYAISSVVGVAADISLGYGETLRRGESGFLHELGGTMDFNFNRRFGIPLGAAVGFKSSREEPLSQAANRSDDTFWFKLAYTGSGDFSIGVDIFRGRYPLHQISEIGKVFGAILNSRFYFN